MTANPLPYEWSAVVVSALRDLLWARRFDELGLTELDAVLRAKRGCRRK